MKKLSALVVFFVFVARVDAQTFSGAETGIDHLTGLENKKNLMLGKWLGFSEINSVGALNNPPWDFVRKTAPRSFYAGDSTSQLLGPTRNMNEIGTHNTNGSPLNLMFRSYLPRYSKEQATFRIDRNSDYVGGDDIWHVHNAFYANCTVGAGVVNAEWCGLFSEKNYSEVLNGQNTSLFAQMWRMSPKATSGFAFVAENSDLTNAANPTSAQIATELDLLANGPDDHLQRITQMIVGGRPEQQPGKSGTTSEQFAGIWIAPKFGNSGEVRFYNGINLMGNYNFGINLANGTYAGSAITVPTKGKIALDGACSDALKCAFPTFERSIYWDGGSLFYSSPKGNVFAVDDDGRLAAGGYWTKGPTILEGAVTLKSTLQLNPYTVDSMPICDVESRGKLIVVSNSSVTYGEIGKTTGPNFILGLCNGIKWMAH
jgi:hypothetical protein